jgi:hypothetical protein
MQDVNGKYFQKTGTSSGAGLVIRPRKMTFYTVFFLVFCFSVRAVFCVLSSEKGF